MVKKFQFLLCGKNRSRSKISISVFSVKKVMVKNFFLKNIGQGHKISISVFFRERGHNQKFQFLRFVKKGQGHKISVSVFSVKLS